MSTATKQIDETKELNQNDDVAAPPDIPTAPEKVRATFNLDPREVITLREIAAEQGVSVTTVLRQMIRDMTDMREIVKNEGGRVVIEGNKEEKWILTIPSIR